MAEAVTIIRDEDGATLTFDAVITYGVNASITVTNHPVESGSAISDHAQPQAKLLAMRVVSSASPYSNRASTGGWDRIQQVIAFMVASEAKLLSVVTGRLGTWDNMILTRYPHAIDGVERLAFDLEFKQVRLAIAGIIQIEPTAPAPATAAAAGLPDAQDVGEQPTTSTTATDGAGATQEATDKSYLLSLTEALGIAPDPA